MKLLKFQSVLQIFTKFANLKFAILVLIIIAVSSSFGSFIEQDQPISFYEINYPLDKPIYGFITYNFILFLGLDHVYRTWWFLFLLTVLAISLISCTVIRQFPLFLGSKNFFFKTQKKAFLNLPFFINFVKTQNIYFLKEFVLLKIQSLNFYIYQTKNVTYAYKGLVGRLSPILVHFSLITILAGSSFGAFNNFKVQEILPKGQVFHIQNPINVGLFTNIPSVSLRVNDFWVEYQKSKIHQFYSNISVLDNYGNEIKEQTISVNNPLKYNSIDFYQSDWNLIGIRAKKQLDNKIYEFPVFSLKSDVKSWVTWLPVTDKTTNGIQSYTLVFDQLQNTFLVYNQEGKFMSTQNIGDSILNSFQLLDIIPSTGLLIKYDPSIPIIYLGFLFLMITTLLSYLPYTQIWVVNQSKNFWIGATTNRGKIQLEIEFENFIRYIEKKFQAI
jgi:cytochrome c biogenesis protein